MSYTHAYTHTDLVLTHSLTHTLTQSPVHSCVRPVNPTLWAFPRSVPQTFLHGPLWSTKGWSGLVPLKQPGLPARGGPPVDRGSRVGPGTTHGRPSRGWYVTQNDVSGVVHGDSSRRTHRTPVFPGSSTEGPTGSRLVRVGYSSSEDPSVSRTRHLLPRPSLGLVPPLRLVSPESLQGRSPDRASSVLTLPRVGFRTGESSLLTLSRAVVRTRTSFTRLSPEQESRKGARLSSLSPGQVSIWRLFYLTLPTVVFWTRNCSLLTQPRELVCPERGLGLATLDPFHDRSRDRD